MRGRLSRAGAVCAALALSAAGARAAEPELRIEEVLREAALRHPAVARARAEVEAERALQDAADAWPDPVLQFGMGLREVETALGPQQQVIALMQRVPFFGKSELRVRGAQHRARAAWHRYREVHLQVIEAAARAYYGYAELAQDTEIAEQSLALLQGIEAVARARYRTGQVDQPTLLRLQVELGTLEDRLRSLRDRRRADSAGLRAAMGLEPGETLPWPQTELEPLAPLPPDAEVLRAVREQSPALAALREARQARGRELDLARRDRMPDWTVGIQNVRIGRSDLTAFEERGRDAWVLQLSVPVPVSRSEDRALVERAAAQARHARDRLREADLDSGQRVERLLFEVRDAARRVELYERSLIPTADASLATLLTAFRTGGAALLDVLDAQRVLLRFQLDLVGARARRATQVVGLFVAMGRVPPGVPEPEEIE